MTTVPIFNCENRPIESVSDWEVRASPGSGRWADGYSAKALAEAWIDGRAPDALLALLGKHGGGRFDGLRLERAIAEAQTRFDEWHGPRNHDLLVTASDDNWTFPIGIEAKVNERFGETLEGCRATACKRERGEPTPAPERLVGLTTALAGAGLDRRPDLGIEPP